MKHVNSRIFLLISFAVFSLNVQANDDQKTEQDNKDTPKEVTGSAFNKYEEYVINSLMTGISPISSSYAECNYEGDIEKIEAPKSIEGEKAETERKNCIAPAGTVVEIRGSGDNKVIFKVTSEVKKEETFYDDRSGLLRKKILNHNNENLISTGILYEASESSFKNHAEVDTGMISGMKAVFIPQKFYERKEYSSSPTLGAAITFQGSEKALIQDRFTFIPSFEIGVGLTQATIDTPSGSDEKFGFALFAGVSFIQSEDLGLGLYYGHDFISLKDGESMNNSTDETPAWLGLVLTVPISFESKNEN